MTTTPALQPQGFATSDPEIAQQFLIDAHLDNRMRLSGPATRFRLRVSRLDPGPSRSTSSS
ncbi:MAG TPA: hypothetical protein VH373_23525 [Jatrophihabitantaceae bacterium]|jgi:hypothetical protein